MRLELSSCIIRSFAAADAVAVQRYADNRNIWINLRDIFPHPYTLENANAFMKFVAQEKLETTFAIATASEAIGCIGLRLGQDIHRKTAELGYWLGEPFWGRGIMSEAVKEFTRQAFEVFDLQRIYAEPFENNRASGRVLDKAGYICEGRLTASVFKGGKVQNSLLYAKTREV